MKSYCLSGEWAVVTGACSGIGLEFSHRLAELGASVVMVSNRERELQEAARDVASRHDVNTLPLTLDLTSERAAEEIMSFIDRNGVDPSVFINNAGIFSFAPVTETPRGKIDCFIGLHVTAVTSLSREFALRFAKRGGGRILNMSSMSCWMPMPGIAMYSATKAYIRAFSRAYRIEMKDCGVSVTVACPGGIATNLFGLPPQLQRLGVSLGVLMTPQAFVRRALKRTFRGKAQYINGLLNRVSIVFVASLPEWARSGIKHRLLDKMNRQK